jgi:ABC-type multidrug transport system ATPase subunit
MVLISSHILAEIQQRVDRLAIMAAGKVQAVGTVRRCAKRWRCRCASACGWRRQRWRRCARRSKTCR